MKIHKDVLKPILYGKYYFEGRYEHILGKIETAINIYKPNLINDKKILVLIKSRGEHDLRSIYSKTNRGNYDIEYLIIWSNNFEDEAIKDLSERGIETLTMEELNSKFTILHKEEIISRSIYGAN